MYMRCSKGVGGGDYHSCGALVVQRGQYLSHVHVLLEKGGDHHSRGCTLLVQCGQYLSHVHMLLKGGWDTIHVVVHFLCSVASL